MSIAEQARREAEFDSRYIFKFDDFSKHFRENYKAHVASMFPSSNRWDFLEVGVLDGRNAVWLLENVLTNEYSTYMGIDWHMKDNALSNLNFFNNKSTLIKADSKQTMRWINKKFNFIYIDSNHISQQCICESALALGMIHRGGVIMWDDYGNDEFPGVKLAVDNFLECFEEGKDYTLLFKNWQAGVKIL